MNESIHILDAPKERYSNKFYNEIWIHNNGFLVLHFTAKSGFFSPPAFPSLLICNFRQKVVFDHTFIFFLHNIKAAKYNAYTPIF